MLIDDLTLLLRVYLVWLLLQVFALPVIFYVSKQVNYIKDALWGFGRIFSLLFLALLVWSLAFLKIPINTSIGVSGFFAFLLLFSLIISWKFFLKKKNFFKHFWQRFGKVILIEEIVFLLGLLFLFAIRSFQPEILGLEKFMDAGFIQAYLKSPTLPVQDIWFANESINYYSFGHFYNALLVHLWRIDLAYAYNLLLVSLFALFVLELFSLAFNLRANLLVKKSFLLTANNYDFKASVLAGFLAIFLVALGANGHTLWYFFTHGNMDNYWYPDATRFIERTIHEFPAYSFVVCDLHAHVLSLPISLFLVVLIFCWLQELISKKTCPKLLAILLGILFGVLVMTNTWDIMIYGLLLTIIALLLLIRDKRFFLGLFWTAALIFLFTGVTAFFWLSHFTAISNALLIATEHTPLWQLLVLWGPHLFWVFLLTLILRPWKAMHSKEITVVILGMAILGLVLFLILFPELFYFKDIYSTYPRANTMFKLVFQGFMLLGILLSLLLSWVFLQSDKTNRFFTWQLIDLRQVFVRRQTRLARLKFKLRKYLLLYLPISIFLFFSTLVYPYSAYRNYYGGFRNYQGLDGLAWFKRKYPDDFVLLSYLKQQEKKQVNIVEAVGESYTEYARISAFSGMPTILGWRVHEWLWRAGWDYPALRTSEVETIYLKPTSDQTQALLAQYQIKYIVIGSKELEAYPHLDITGLLTLGESVVTQNQHYLIKLF
jgi:uncharacterized membrane protein